MSKPQPWVPDSNCYFYPETTRDDWWLEDEGIPYASHEDQEYYHDIIASPGWYPEWRYIGVGIDPRPPEEQ